MTEAELLELVRREISERREEHPRPRTAKRCRACYAEHDGALSQCPSCGSKPHAATTPGKVVASPEAGATDAPVLFAVEVRGERRALLGPGGKLVLGRGERADVWLEGSTVSRAHVEIAWDEGATYPRFRDLGSANGTRHLGLLRGEGLLRPGDVLEVGTHSIKLAREERPALLADPSDGLFDAYFDVGPELGGPIGPGTTSVILRALAAAGRTGTFEIALERGTGCVVLAAGRVVSARCGRTVGLAAIHLILCAETGAYRFHREFEVDDGDPVDMSVEEVLAAVPA